MTERDFEIDLPPAWQRHPNDGGFEWRRADDSQLIITIHELTADAPMREVLARMLEIRQRVAREIDPKVQFSTIAHEDFPDRRVATYTCTTSDNTGAFTALVASNEPLADQHILLTFAFTGGTHQLDEARTLYTTLRFRPHADAIRRAVASSGTAVDLARVYPYLAPVDYVPGRTPFKTIGHGIALLLAEDADGAARILFPDDVPDAAIERAHANLEARLKAGDIPIAQYEIEGTPLVRFGDHWLASACLLLPGVPAFLRRTLGTELIAAAIPHRDVLACFPCEDPEVVARMQLVLNEREADGRKPLTQNLFALVPGGPHPL